MYSSVLMSKLDVTLLQTLFQILLWIQPTFLSTMGFHSCSLHWMQSITNMSKGELCWAPLSPIKTENTFQNMIERLVDPAQFFMLNPCHGWDELNKILYGFEYWDLLKTFQAYSFYPFWLFHTLTDFPKPHSLESSLSIAGKAGQSHVSCVPRSCPWLMGLRHIVFGCTAGLFSSAGIFSPFHSLFFSIWTLSLQMHNIYKLVVLPHVLY